jgi:hypothetical protein
VVDGRVFTGTAPGTRVSLDLDPPFYIGGVSDDAVELALDIVQVKLTFVLACITVILKIDNSIVVLTGCGCIRNVVSIVARICVEPEAVPGGMRA